MHPPRSLQPSREKSQAWVNQPALDRSAAGDEHVRLIDFHCGAPEDPPKLLRNVLHLAFLPPRRELLSPLHQTSHHERTSSQRMTMRSLARGSSCNCRTRKLRPF